MISSVTTCSRCFKGKLNLNIFLHNRKCNKHNHVVTPLDIKKKTKKGVDMHYLLLTVMQSEVLGYFFFSATILCNWCSHQCNSIRAQRAVYQRQALPHNRTAKWTEKMHLRQKIISLCVYHCACACERIWQRNGEKKSNKVVFNKDVIAGMGPQQLDSSALFGGFSADMRWSCQGKVFLKHRASQKIKGISAAFQDTGLYCCAIWLDNTFW